jgi:hypothetical protein
MYKRILNSIVLTSLGALVAIPAAAQSRVDLGPVHIRIARDAPPRVQKEYRSPRPQRDSVWIAGYWDRQDDRWNWVAGRWEQPYDRHSRWINARYKREGRAWRYEPAHWSDQRLVEGEDYRQWRDDQRSDRDRREDARREADRRSRDAR